MSRRNESPLEMILDILSKCPWWVSIAFGALVFFGLEFLLPSLIGNDPMGKSIAAISRPLAPWIAAIFLIPVAISAFTTSRKRRQLDSQSGIDSIRQLSPKEFEELLAEAYRRSGYVVRENTSLGPDGGVDLTIEKGGNRYLVQAKHWKVFKVGVKVVREMFGLMVAEGASGVIIVTSGMFTQEAENFAQDKPIDLVAGDQLVEMIRCVQANPRSAQSIPSAVPIARSTPPPSRESATPTAANVCPRCGNQLVRHIARKGNNAGKPFWGCKGFPNCRYTRNID